VRACARVCDRAAGEFSVKQTSRRRREGKEASKQTRHSDKTREHEIRISPRRPRRRRRRRRRRLRVGGEREAEAEERKRGKWTKSRTINYT
jgi:hypothetical protein